VTGPAARLAALSDDELAARLVELGRAIEHPSAPPDLTDRVIARLAAAPRTTADVPAGEFRQRLGRLVVGRGYEGPRLRRAVALALVALLVVAGLAAAVAFGLPGIRLIFVAQTPTPVTVPPSPTSPAGSPSLPALGPSLAPGRPVTIDDARAAADFAVEVPTDPILGAADASTSTARAPPRACRSCTGRVPACRPPLVRPHLRSSPSSAAP